MDITLLGTGGMLPLKDRFLTSCYVEHNGKAVLIDCGEGTQVAIAKHDLKLSRIEMLLITHSHADHVTGLPGLLLSLGNTDRQSPLPIYLPASAENAVRGLLQVCGRLPYPVLFRQLPEREAVSFTAQEIDPMMTISVLPLRHTVPCLGYRIELRKKPEFQPEQAKALDIPVQFWKRLHSGEHVTLPDGREILPAQVTGAARPPVRIVYTTDTLPIPQIADLAAGADLFVCEGMWGDPERKENLNSKRHMLMQDACRLAAQAQAKRLWLTHYSPAEKDPAQYLKTLQSICPAVTVSRDGERITLR